MIEIWSGKFGNFEFERKKVKQKKQTVSKQKKRTKEQTNQKKKKKERNKSPFLHWIQSIQSILLKSTCRC